MFIGLLSVMAAAALGAADQAPAQAAPANDYTLVGPSQGALERYRPTFHGSMRVVVSCVATADNGLDNCKVLSTAPKNDKIGEQAIKVAKTIKLKRPDGWTPGAPETIEVAINWPQVPG